MISYYNQFVTAQLYLLSITRTMRFEVIFLRDKLKLVEQTLSLIINLMKTKEIPYNLFFIYLSEDEIRVLVNRIEAPIVLVLSKNTYASVVSCSKGSEENSTLGFQIKQGLQFLLELHSAIKQQASEHRVTQEDNCIRLKIGKQQSFRYLQIKLTEKIIKLEIQKPTKNENQLFSYSFIDGVRDHIAFFQCNATIFLQFLKLIHKNKNSYPVHNVSDKFLSVEIDLVENRLKTSFKAITSSLQQSTILTRDDIQRNQKFIYSVHFENCETVLSAMKPESSFVIDEQKELVINYSEQGIYQCQISLKNWVEFVEVQQQDVQLIKTQR